MAIPSGWDPIDRSSPVRSGWMDTPALGDAHNVTVALEHLVIGSRHTMLRPGGWAYRLAVGSPSGWWDPAPDATATLDHPSGDGTIPLTPRMGARIIEVVGWIECAPGALMPAIREMQSVAGGRLVVDDGANAGTGLRLEADVRRTRLAISRNGTEVHCPFRLVLVADDPLRYGTATHTLTNGSNQLLNRGDATAFPLLELRGPHNAVTVAHPGGSFSFPSLTSSQRRLIDARNGDVWNLANDQRVFVGSGPWPRVEEGGSTWQVSGLGSGTAVVRRFEAWS